MLWWMCVWGAIPVGIYAPRIPGQYESPSCFGGITGYVVDLGGSSNTTTTMTTATTTCLCVCVWWWRCCVERADTQKLAHPHILHPNVYICYYCCAALDLEAQIRSVCGTCCWATHGLTREIIRLVPISVITYANTKYKLLKSRLTSDRQMYIKVGILFKNSKIYLFVA